MSTPLSDWEELLDKGGGVLSNKKEFSLALLSLAKGECYFQTNHQTGFHSNEYYTFYQLCKLLFLQVSDSQKFFPWVVSSRILILGLFDEKQQSIFFYTNNFSIININVDR